MVCASIAANGSSSRITAASPLKLAHRDLANQSSHPFRQPHRLRRQRRARSQRGPGGAERAELPPTAEGDQLRHRQRKVTLDRRDLRQVGHSPPQPRSAIHHPASERDDTRYRRKERALAGTVRADNRGQTPRNKLAAHGLQRDPPPIAHGYLAQQDPAVSFHVSDRAKPCPSTICPASRGYGNFFMH